LALPMEKQQGALHGALLLVNWPEYRKEMAAKQYEEMKGDKGSRGTAYDQDFEKLEKSRVSRAKSVTANRNRSPEELGLKQWGGD